MELEEGVKELHRRIEKAKQMGGEEKVKQQHAKGRLTARERIDKLLDPGSFWEAGILIGTRDPQTGEPIPENRVSGIGRIDGRKVGVMAQDRTILGGSGGGMAGQKGRITEIGREAGYPIVILADEAGGRRLPEGIGSRGMFGGGGVRQRGGGGGVYRQTPNIVAIMGECFGEPAWQAAQADLVVMVKGTAMGAAGPRILAESISQRITPQELAGWEVQAQNGQVDVFAENDEEALAIIRKMLSYLPSHIDEEPPYVPPKDDQNRRLDDIDKIVPVNKLSQGYDMYRVVRRIVDDGEYLAIKAEYGKALVTCLARIGGRVVGIIANNPMYNAGAPDVPAFTKHVEFVRLCDTWNIPIIYLQDVPGIYPGRDAEKEKAPTWVVMVLRVMGLTTVPRIGVLIRKAYGIGWMITGARHEDFRAVWPTASISFVDPEIGVAQVYGRKLSEIEDPEKREAERQRLLAQFSAECAPWEGAQGSNVEVIDPRDTRKWIAECLDILRGNRGNFMSEHRLANWPTSF